MTRLIRKIRGRRSKSFESARADIGYFYHRQHRRARIIKKYKNWARKYLKTRYFPRPWYGKNSMERVKNLESKSPIRRRRLSPHAKQSRKYLRMRYHFFNAKPRSFYRTAYKAYIIGKQLPGPKNWLAYMLEGRIDSLLYRANFIRNKRFTRVFIKCGNACVNGFAATNPSYPVEVEQTVTLLNNPHDSQYRVIPRYGVFAKRSKLSKRRKKFVRYIKRYRKKTRKTYKKKHFLFLFKGVFDKNWKYRKKIVLHKLKLLKSSVGSKFKPTKSLHKKFVSKKIKVSTVEETKKKLQIFRMKFRQMTIELRNLMRVKRFTRIAHLFIHRKRAFKNGIIFTRSVLKRSSRRKLFSKRFKKRRFFVVAFHQFKRAQLKRAEVSRYLYYLYKLSARRRNSITSIKKSTQFKLPGKLKKARKLVKQQRLVSKKIKLNLQKQFNKLNFSVVQPQTTLPPNTLIYKKVSYSYKALLKKLCIFRIRRLIYLRNLCLFKYYFLLLKNVIPNFCKYVNIYKYCVLICFSLCFKSKNKSKNKK